MVQVSGSNVITRNLMGPLERFVDLHVFKTHSGGWTTSGITISNGCARNVPPVSILLRHDGSA